MSIYSSFFTKRVLLAVLFTVGFATLILYSGVTKALSIFVTPNSLTYNHTDTAQFTVHVKQLVKERIIQSDALLSITGPFSKDSFTCNLQITDHAYFNRSVNCAGQELIVTFIPQNNFGFGYGYSYGGFGYGYGGFGYGYRFGETSFTFIIDWQVPNSFDPGKYTSLVQIDTSRGPSTGSALFFINGVTTTILTTTTVPPTTTSSTTTIAPTTSTTSTSSTTTISTTTSSTTTIAPTTSTTTSSTTTITPTTSITTSTTTSSTTTVSHGGGGPAITGGGGGGGGGGPNGPTVTAFNNSTGVGFKIDNFTVNNCKDLVVQGKHIHVCVSFITSTFAVIIANNVTYNLTLNVPVTIDPSNGYNYWAKLSKISYVPILHTITVLLYATPIPVPVQNSTTIPTTSVVTTTTTIPAGIVIIPPQSKAPLPIIPILGSLAIVGIGISALRKRLRKGKGRS